MTEPQNKSILSRRTALIGAAWTAPAVAIAAAAPLMASSPPRTPATLSARGSFAWSQKNALATFTSTTNSTGTAGLFVNNNPNFPGEVTTVTSATVTIWIPVNNATWTSTSTATWSAPTATGATSTNGGVTYYAYESTLQTTPTLSGTTGVLPNLTFTMPATASPGTYYVQVDAAIKTTRPTDPAYIPWTQNLTTTKLGPVNIIIN